MSGPFERVRAARRGKVWLVGAGPGDPELLTVRAERLLVRAEVVAYDELVSKEVLALAPVGAEIFAVGRRARGCRHHEAKIHPRVLALALSGRSVVRLKGGDPFVFGRGGEEAEELAAARIPFEVVPGISAGLAAAARVHVPLTHREVASSVTFATAHAAGDAEDARLVTGIPTTGTLVLYMGLSTLEERLAALVAAGRSPQTPCALVASATLPGERVLRGTLGTLAPLVRAAGIEPPAVVIVGEVVARAVESPLEGSSSSDEDEKARSGTA